VSLAQCGRCPRLNPAVRTRCLGQIFSRLSDASLRRSPMPHLHTNIATRFHLLRGFTHAVRECIRLLHGVAVAEVRSITPFAPGIGASGASATPSRQILLIAVQPIPHTSCGMQLFKCRHAVGAMTASLSVLASPSSFSPGQALSGPALGAAAFLEGLSASPRGIRRQVQQRFQILTVPTTAEGQAARRGARSHATRFPSETGRAFSKSSSRRAR